MEPKTPSASTAAAAPSRIGGVTLNVRDLPVVSAFYRDVIGLDSLSTHATSAVLGAADQPLLTLRQDKAARPRQPSEPGLFHTAFLLPDRTDLGGWLISAADKGVALQGASDHHVSEALYLADPEGNGIEIYADRPREGWVDGQGRLLMTTERLDLAELTRAAAGRPWRGIPAGSVIGHVHLQTGELASADGFYADLLGYDVTCRYPGASFYGADGYHHQLAANIWNSRGASPRAEGAAGLASVELIADSADMLATLRRRTGRTAAGPIALSDPFGIAFTVTEPRPT